MPRVSTFLRSNQIGIEQALYIYYALEGKLGPTTQEARIYQHRLHDSLPEATKLKLKEHASKKEAESSGKGSSSAFVPMDVDDPMELQ